MQGDEILNSFFHDRLRIALRHEGITPSDMTFIYLLGLLRDPTRVDMELTLFDTYKRAMTSLDHGTRFESFRCLGDASLFMAGFFRDYVDGTLVGRDYYVTMGKLGYSNASMMVPGGLGHALDELSYGFVSFIDALSRIQKIRG